MTHRLLLIGLFLTLFPGAWAQTCFSGWGYYQPLTIYNPGSTPLTDMQVPVPFATNSLVDSSQLLPDGADLRLVDTTCAAIPFYLTNPNSDSSVLWIKVPALAAGDSLLLHLYYDNDTAASVASGDDTFLFFDDFSGTDVDLTKWEAVGGFQTFQISNGRLAYSSSGSNPGPRFKFARTTAVFSEEVVFDFNAQVTNANGFGFSSTDTVLERIIFRQSGFGFDTLNQVAYNADTLNNGVSISQTYPIIRFPRSQPTDGSIRAGVSGNKLSMYRFENLNENSVSLDTFTVQNTDMSGFHFIVSAFLSQTIFLDYLRVRKPLPTDVFAQLGMETMILQDTMPNDTTPIDTMPNDTTPIDTMPNDTTPIDTMPNDTTPTSIAASSSLGTMHVFPNPATEMITLHPVALGTYEVLLVDVQGRTLYRKRHDVRTDQLPIAIPPDLPSGTYWLLLQGNGHPAEKVPILIRR